ncbi:PH domain-containing protein [Streptomyces sp. NPDC003832]
MSGATDIELRARLRRAEVRADAAGLHIRTPLRRRTVPWADIADLRPRVTALPRGGQSRRLVLVPREGRPWLLPLPATLDPADPGFDAAVDGLRALHRRHGSPDSDRLVVLTERTAAGRGSAWLPVLCVLFLLGAGLAAHLVPRADGHYRDWRAAVPCPAATPAADRRECLDVLPAVVERTEERRKQRGLLYFTAGRPVARVAVSREAALEFRPGDRVELTVWRGAVMEISGSRFVWREHVSPPGDLAVVSAGLALAAGYPAARMLIRAIGRRRLAADEVLPSSLPWAAVLIATGAWLLPLCHRHPTTLASSQAAPWWLAGATATLAMTAWAVRATRVRRPAGADAIAAEDTEVFLPARFLDATDYNPHHFGTHIAIGGGEPPAVTPGPGRYAARTVPARRLTVRDVRRARGSDGDTVPRSWHVADLDDVGTPVRLAAAPTDLARILRALGAAGTLEEASTPRSER